MKRRAICAAAAALLLLIPCGCWSYRGLDDMTLVAGVGIDYDAQNGDYLLSCEVIDPSNTNKETGVKSKLVEARGKSVMDAVRNAKKRLINRLYWGNTQVLILGGGLLKDGNLNFVVDWFLRDAECRETVGVIVSNEKSAEEMLKIKGLDSSVVAYEIQKILDDDQKDTASLLNVPVYRVYDTLHTPGIQLALPAFHLTENDGQKVAEADGEVLFKGGKPVGALSAEESKYFLYAVDGVRGGILVLRPDSSAEEEFSLEVSGNKTDRSYTYEKGKLTFTLKTVTEAYLDEHDMKMDILDDKEIRKMENEAETYLKKNIEGAVRKVQKEYRSDVFGFGYMIYRKDPKLWKQLAPKWDEIFPSLGVKVECEVKILETSFVKGG